MRPWRLSITGNYAQKNGTCAWGANCIVGVLRGTEGCQLEGLPFLWTPHSLFSAVNCGGQCHCIYMHLSGRGCICLSPLEKEWFAAHRGENTGCAQNGNTGLAIIPNPSREPRRGVCGTPVATCHNPQNSRQDATKKNRPSVGNSLFSIFFLFFLNCCTHLKDNRF